MFLVALGRKVDSVLEGKNMLAVVLHTNDEPAIILRLVVECLGQGADLSIVLGRGISILIRRRRAGRSWRAAYCCRPWVFEHLSRAAECRVSLTPPGGIRFVSSANDLLRDCCFGWFLAASPACILYNYRFIIASFTLRRLTACNLLLISWLAKHHDINRLILMAGHSATVTWENYHRGMSQAEAKKFWAINPPNTTANIVAFEKSIIARARIQ